MKHKFQWHTASPLWGLSLQDSGPAPKRFFQPALLRFSGDSFMEEMQHALAQHPERLAEYVARPETWREEQAGWVNEAQLAQQEPLKLYQPAHNRFYLAAANLVCQTRGLPDRAVNAAAEETVSFVVRRLVPREGAAFDPENEQTYDEHGWFGDRQQGAWAQISPRESVVSGEERLAAFPLTFQENGRKRRLIAGLIPVGSREAYEAGAPPLPASATAGDPLNDERLAAFRESVIAGFEQLRDLPVDPNISEADNDEARLTLGFVLLDFAEFLSAELPDVWKAVDQGSGAALEGAGKALYDFLTESAVIGTHDWSDLIDSAWENRDDLLAGTLSSAMLFNDPAFDRSAIQSAAGALLAKERCPPVTDDGQDSLDSTDVNQQAELDYKLACLVAAALDDPRKGAWRDIVTTHIEPLKSLPTRYSDARAREALLEALLPVSEFLSRELPSLSKAIESGNPAGLNATQRAIYDLLESNTLKAVSWRALLADAEKHRAEILSGQFPAGLVVIRAQWSRADVESFTATFATSGIEALVAAAFDADPLPDTPGVTASPAVFYKLRFVYEQPRCGRAARPVVSRASWAFQLAAFFDSDAPVRKFSIEMPADTSIGGLRDFPKNFSVKMSDELRKQMARAQSAGMEGLMSGVVPEGQLPNLGMICSFSIPIITICALILLMIIVQLLNIVFWWLPLFRICLPLPFKAK